MKRIARGFFAIFKIPQNMLIFISGILLATAINIVTNEIGDCGIEWSYGLQVTFSTIFMFISSCCFTILAVYVKPIQEKHKKEHPIAIRINNKEVWFEDIKMKKGAVTTLSLLFILTYITFLLSVILLFWDQLKM